MAITRCLYHATLYNFIHTNPHQVLGLLHSAYHGGAFTTTDEAWLGEIQLLQEILQKWQDEPSQIIFEYNIPRLGKRIDVVLLLRGKVFCLEFKMGEKDKKQADLEQVLDYALDLKNFHMFSHDREIIPILIPSKYPYTTTVLNSSIYDDVIYNPLVTGAKGLQKLLCNLLNHSIASPVCDTWYIDWIISPYSPTPTIIEAARYLYENHSVEDITKHEANKVSTDATISYVMDVIAQSKIRGEKSICFVTGVPGAGKTLVGLDIAVRQTYKDGKKADLTDGAVYLSGNGPLVAVLTEALAKDNYKKCKARGERKNLSDCRREVGKFIQIIHRYRDNMLAKIQNPVVDGHLQIDPEKAVKLAKSGYGEVEHVAIFDEAQRSWTHERIANYLKRGGTYGNKLKVANFPMSEAEFLIWSLDQREDWAVIICLVGGGQEINTGEAGIAEWIAAINNTFPHWHTYISPNLTDIEYAEGRVDELLAENPHVTKSDKLHLAVSQRSFRAETVSQFVHAVLARDSNANELYKEIQNHRYPIVITRDMAKAREWLRRQARGNERTGVLLTKAAARYQPHAIHVLPNDDQNAIVWFLEDTDHIHSSNFLEDAATEIQVQGLELDYTCVLWDADMRYLDGEWQFFKFSGYKKWIPVPLTENGMEERKYMLNAYRVLLTRARQGMVICVPKGNDRLDNHGFHEDTTCLPEYYDTTYQYLCSIGINEL